jgi:hypothetical protein
VRTCRPRDFEENTMGTTAKRPRAARLAWVAALGLAVASGGAARAQEMSAFGINLFGLGANECGSTDPVDGSVTADLSFCDDWVDVMEDSFDAEGWNQTENRTNTEVDGRDWTDASLETWGQDDVDPFGTDFAEVTMLCSHGGSAANVNSFFLMGDDDAGEDCTPETDDNILFGDTAGGDLEVAILGTCESAQFSVWDTTGYFDVLDSDGSFNTWLGFHGVSYDSNNDTNRFEDYVTDSFANGLGDNFLDELHRNPIGADNSQCPVAIVFCELEADCDTQFDFGGFDDRHKVASTDAKVLSKIFFIGGCDPDDGIELPN